MRRVRYYKNSPRLCVSAASTRALRAVSALAAAALFAIPGPASALNNDTVLLLANAGATYNSNVLGISNQLPASAVDQFLGGRSEGAWIWNYGAGLRCDLPVSRQRFELDLAATRYDYTEFSELDYTGYTARGVWDWRAGNDWNGQVKAGVVQSRQTYTSGVLVNIPALVKNYSELVDAHYALTPRWEINGSLSAGQSRYNEVALQPGNFNVTDQSIGAVYRTPLGNETGLRLTFEQGNWPNRTPATGLTSEYSQYMVGIVVNWNLTGRSNLAGDFGYTVRTSAGGTASRHVEGPSGRLTYTYVASGKSQLQASLYQTFGPLDDPTASYAKTTGLDLGYTYQITAKTSLQAGVSYWEVSYLGAPPGTLERQDKYTTLTVGAKYQATRTLSFSASAQYLNRTSNIPFAAYDVYTVSLGANIAF
jgi:hypothetical protein